MSTKLGQIAKKAKLDREVRFTSLAHLLTPAFLKETWRMMNRHAASGVDGLSTEQFASEMEQRVEEIYARFGGSRYPKGRARSERDHWGFPLSLTGCCSGRSRAFSRLYLKPIFSIAVTAFDQGATLITPCRLFACIS